MHGRVNFFHSEKTLPFFDFDHREEMKFTYAQVMNTSSATSFGWRQTLQ